jgi:uncharacterized SAM-binding protein YcdF (DUF218 family)
VLYSVSKALWLIAQPTHLLSLLMVLGTVLLFTRRRRLGLGLMALDALLILTIAVLPVGHWLMATLEDRFPPPGQMPGHVDGVIMLGGEESIAFADLARRYPKAKLVFAGGGPMLQNRALRKVDAAPNSSQWMGIDTSRITFERESRNTLEDVVSAKAVVHPTRDETWILITSAFHMPRSVGLFRAQGWRVVPYPVDFQTRAGPDNAVSSVDFAHNIDQLSVALKEWIGMFANRLLGHSKCFFPGPAS